MNLLKTDLDEILKIKNDIFSSIETIELLEIEYDDTLLKELEISLPLLKERLSSVELNVLLNGEYDKNNCILEIHSGAGGTEACDWALMLHRIYTRWCEKKGYKIEELSIESGDEAGIKSVTLLVKGNNSFGYLKSEKGVHRLVRISPFDANSKRHTSFASVDITPEFNDNINIEIDENNLKIDVYHSGGAGGQSVNTTDSAVRITHLPTKIVVTCQNERSQLKNKDVAMKILKSKLMQLEIEKQKQRLSDMKSNNMAINFGSQIRSYVMHPYSMVKDHRTNSETSAVNKVLDGDIDMFIESYLRSEVNESI